MQRVTSPDGREWEISSSRLQLPPWRQQDWGSDWEGDPLGGVVAFVEAFAGTVVVPLALATVEPPIALARSAVTRRRRVEAVCRWPSDLRIVWTTSRENADAVCGEIARQLEAGYDRLAPANATFVEMTSRPGSTISKPE